MIKGITKFLVTMLQGIEVQKPVLMVRLYCNRHTLAVGRSCVRVGVPFTRIIKVTSGAAQHLLLVRLPACYSAFS